MNDGQHLPIFKMYLTVFSGLKSFDIFIEIVPEGFTKAGGHLNMSSYQYRDPRVKDKTLLRPFYLKHGNPHTYNQMSCW